MIHRYWADYGHKTATRSRWTVCSAGSDGMSVLEDLESLREAKQYAEKHSVSTPS